MFISTVTILAFSSLFPGFLAHGFNPSTCSRKSTSACLAAYDTCCAYVCAEAQVPFQICSPEKETVLAQRTKCPTHKPTKHKVFTKRPCNNNSATSTDTPRLSTLSLSTCTPSVVTSGPACPAVYDQCCAWTCGEAQVPYPVCQHSDGTGEFALCTRCPSPTPMP